MRRLLAAVVLLVLTACGSNGGDETTPLAQRTIEAGEVTVEIDPVAIDPDGASFEITLDTHSVELDMDIAKEASLEVDGEPWSGATWEGDGPDGHHREGTLTFEAGGTAEGSATLTLDGFPAPVEATWDLR